MPEVYILPNLEKIITQLKKQFGNKTKIKSGIAQIK
jgi:hypothetical protein